MSIIGVSFVIPIYNKRAFLPQMVAGLAAQQGDFEREFIFIDDGSTDGSLDEIRRLAPSLPGARVLTQPNRGPSHATNRGFAEARHPFVKAVDADDVLLPWATWRLVDGLLRHPGAVAAFADSQEYDSAEQALARLSAAMAQPSPARTELIADPLAGLLGRSRIAAVGPSNSLYTLAAARAAGGCDTRVFVQDFSLSLRLALRGPFVRLDEAVVLTAATAPGRINDGGPQVLHDLNLSLSFFLAEHRAEIPPALLANAIRRTAMRAWLWTRRYERTGFFSPWAVMALRASLPGAPLSLVESSCRAFTQSRPVRRSVP